MSRPEQHGRRGNGRDVKKSITAAALIVLMALATLIVWGEPSAAQAAERRFPPPQFETDHQVPVLSFPALDDVSQSIIDVTMLVLLLGVATWLVLRRRTRASMVGLGAISLFYFGFVRQGCVCPIGAIQNMTLGLTDASYVLPWVVAAFFLLPIIFTLIAGRVFCSGVCPLGAIQDLVSLRAVQLPLWLEHSLGLLAYAYLGLAVLFAATGSGFIICQYDPFVGIFRLSGGTSMLIFGGVLLVIGLFIIRPYCRFLCPYGVILGFISPIARHKPRLDPVGCINCHLCKDTCPVNAIVPPAQAEGEPVVGRSMQRRRLVGAMLLLPVLVALGAASGWAARDTLVQFNPIVSWADFLQARIDKVAADAAAGTSQNTPAWQPSEAHRQVLARAQVMRGQFDLGSPILGGFLGLVVGGKLLLLSRPTGSSEYDIAQSRCVACGRCFEYCPHHPRNEQALAELTIKGGQP